MNRLSKWKIAVYLTALFLAGAATGGFVACKVMRHQMFKPPNPEHMSSRWCAELHSRLNLTPDQLQRIKPLVNEAIAGMRDAMTGHFSTTISNVNARIAVELTPEQRVKFEEMIKEYHEMMRRKLGEKPAAGWKCDKCQSV